MGKKAKLSKRSDADTAPDVLPVTAKTPPGSSGWPVGFASPRMTVLAGCLILVVTFLFLVAAAMNNLLWLKRLTGFAAGLFHPETLPMGVHSWDAAAVLWGLATTTILACVHPALGLGVFILIRPWLDGYTYPSDNTYFVWGTVILVFVAFAKRIRSEQLPRCDITHILLGALLLVAAIGIPFSQQLDESYREYMLWSSYGLLFLLAGTVGATKPGFYTILAALMMSMAAQSLFSLVHFEYLLPYLREQIQDPSILRQYFGTDTITPELAFRFNVNRAFGSMLMPNALAAFLILGLPFCVLGSFWASQKRANILGSGVAPQPSSRRAALAAAVGMWLAVWSAIFAMVQFANVYTVEALPWYREDLALFVIVTLLALLPAGAVFLESKRHGMLAAAYGTLVVALPIQAVVQGYCLWITYSRGGMLAIIAAAVMGAALLYRGGQRSTRLLQRLPGWAMPAVVIFSLLTPLLLGMSAADQSLTHSVALQGALGQLPANTPGPPPEPNLTTEVLEEGVNPGSQILMNPASFKLRLGYWHVGMRMFLDRPLVGTGLGNFGVAYPNYQYLGAGDVKEAHNSFLQMFCETGVLGGTLFALFWAYFLWRGALRILREESFQERLLLTGLFAGIFAFILHSAVDISFAHPSLAMFGFIAAGLFDARFSNGPPTLSEAPAKGRRPLAPMVFTVAVLVFSAQLLGLTVRTYLHDIALGNRAFINVAADTDLDRQFSAAYLFLNEGPEWKAAPRPERPQIRFGEALDLIRDPSELAHTGQLFVPLANTPTGYRRLQDDEPIPLNATLVLTKPWIAYQYAVDGAIERIKELERIDSRFPHDPELAWHIARWCELLTRHMYHPRFAELRAAYDGQYEAWAAEAVRRGPLQPDLRVVYADVLMSRGRKLEQAEAMDYFRRGLEQYRMATELNRTIPEYLVSYANALHAVADFEKHGLDAAARETYRQAAESVHAAAQTLREERWALGLT